ncbi:ASCH domain-containing protein [Clostridium sp. DSM 8431]|uniref:ASCH domain-containing protein n=1 Tax=Clostridium sp. DSM 8431 TaxID=1761781 RepID=UPI001587AB79|nr:ASCH domain-containing protein [Clostridium sp. DSM 8431]
MRREIDRYFTEYLTSIEKTKDYISDDNKIVIELDNETIENIINNEKNTFISSIYSYDSFFKTMPSENAYTVLTNKRKPKCIIKTLKVETIKFEDITEDNINLENNYLSIDEWKQKHIGIFEEECREAFRVFNPNVPIVIETFELVYI